MSTIAAPAPWWREAHLLLRFVSDLTAAELARLRPGQAAPPLPWPSEMRLADDLGADSLERLQLATALTEATHLQRASANPGLLAASTIGEWAAVVAAGLDAFSAQMTFRTSGSTGLPKWCVHERADLEAEAGVLAEIFAGGRRVLGAVSSHHIYGFLFTLLLPSALGAAFVDVRAMLPAHVAAELTAGDVVIGYPEFWRAFAGASRPIAAGTAGVNSTGPCSPDVARTIGLAGLRLVDVYGSSETAGIGWREDPGAAYRLFAYWRRGAAERELIRARPDGGERTLLVPDGLVWETPRLVRPAGRADGAVQIGGVNVFPERVAALLRTHPAVAQAAVRLMRPDEGGRLKAFIVPEPGAAAGAALNAELRVWFDAHLSAPERPKSIVFGERLPAGALGKPADWPIASDTD